MYLYSGAILADTGKLPIQHVLYVGNRPWSETTSMQGPDVSYRYRLTDLRDFEAGPLLESEQVDDNLLAILCRIENRHEAVRRVVRRIAQLPRAAQIERQGQLMVLSGLRDLSAIIEEEMSRMPITADIRENYFARKYYKEGAEEGARAEAASMLAIALEQRFGSPPQWVRDRINSADRATLERWMRASFHAATLEETLN